MRDNGIISDAAEKVSDIFYSAGGVECCKSHRVHSTAV